MSKQQQPTPPGDITFEAAMDRLEAIVEEMESGKMPLEQLITRYEEGMKLVKISQERLTNAERRIEMIARDHAGKPAVKDFAAATEPARAAKSEAKGENDDEPVSLF